MTDISIMLDKLADINSQLDLVKIAKKEALDSILTPEQKQEIAFIESEFGEKEEMAQAKYTEIESQIRDLAESTGKSVAGEFLRADYNPGRITWDTKEIEKRMINDLEFAQMMLPYRKQGKPFFAIKKR